MFETVTQLGTFSKCMSFAGYIFLSKGCLISLCGSPTYTNIRRLQKLQAAQAKPGVASLAC